ncbi:bacteriocin immunity protein [Companilactobacillus suantsaicola]|uniref:Bacteriocin immunity protein n=1 Tax=Companilactobacillus suantsaicola TaxID=2487723 RepID=A0A4Z0JKQ8_9LACO|nr:bacteriocin immunity protein [Companilactobacillus suantsaicola]TGD22379.1 bacteriocin immunity protein [Companilactobacillus suantsaicola]
MSEEKKLQEVKKVNQLLNRLNTSVQDNDAIKKEILTAYAVINKSEKVSQQQKQIPEAIRNLNWYLRNLAFANEYHFTKEQNDIINQLEVMSRSLKDSPIGIINGVTMGF